MTQECFFKSIVCALTLLLSACLNYGSVDGVDNLWRDIPLERFQKGVTSQSEVLDVLGPPSQLINLDNQVVFYYLAQQNEGRGKAFIVWNQLSEERRYDRAIFFFDPDGVLQEVAYSKETIPR
jgi:outer membrane protein assembly factor BamE (lipoprotein component of BamABCDE complex)